jgi:hypothetical protein
LSAFLCSEEEWAPAGRPTLDEVTRHLRKGYDVLYLAAHGVFSREGTPLVHLEDRAGAAERQSWAARKAR